MEIDLDELPFSVIVVDQSGKILEYDARESELAGLARKRVLGRSFFRDVAPCTAIRDFEGRFDAFTASEDTAVEPFAFRFARGAQRVTVAFVRVRFDSEHTSICIGRSTPVVD